MGINPRVRLERDREAVAAVGGSRNERLRPQGEQVVLTHQPQHALGVEDQPLAPQGMRDPPIAAVTVRQRVALDEIAQIRVVARRGMRSEMAIIAGARHAAERAQAFDVRVVLKKALRLVRGHFLDDFVEMGAPLAGRLASQSRKASRKKCRSAC